MDEAEACVRRALALARSRGARVWEIRAATSLGRLLAAQRRTADAASVLEAAYSQFAEGFDLPDLQDAQALLTELA